MTIITWLSINSMSDTGYKIGRTQWYMKLHDFHTVCHKIVIIVMQLCKHKKCLILKCYIPPKYCSSMLNYDLSSATIKTYWTLNVSKYFIYWRRLNDICLHGKHLMVSTPLRECICMSLLLALNLSSCNVMWCTEK